MLEVAQVPRGSLGRRFGVGLLAHFMASLAGAVAFVALAFAIHPTTEAFGIFLFILLAIFVAGLPGFVVLRVLLHLTGRTGWGWFMAAGMANGALFVLAMAVNSGHPADRGTAMTLVMAVVVGAVAGAVYQRVEAALLQEPEGHA